MQESDGFKDSLAIPVSLTSTLTLKFIVLTRPLGFMSIPQHPRLEGLLLGAIAAKLSKAYSTWQELPTVKYKTTARTANSKYAALTVAVSKTIMSFSKNRRLRTRKHANGVWSVATRTPPENGKLPKGHRPIEMHGEWRQLNRSPGTNSLNCARHRNFIGQVDLTVRTLVADQIYLIQDADTQMQLHGDPIGRGELLCFLAAEAISRPHNYRFYKTRTENGISDHLRSWPRTLQGCNYREFRCSQDKNYHTPVKHTDPSKWRNRESMDTFNCKATLKMIFLPTEEEQEHCQLHRECPLDVDSIILLYSHAGEHHDHPGRENAPIPPDLIGLIMKGQFQSPRECFRQIRTAMFAQNLRLSGSLITPQNVSYWWSISLERKLGPSSIPPWDRALMYLMKMKTVNRLNCNRADCR
jgi:hypothetical protein